GAGLSGQIALQHLPAASPVVPTAPSTASSQTALQDVAVGPGVAPWVSGRAGIPGSNEGGLTYSGQALRLDLRHAFLLTRHAAISLGLGGSALLARHTGEEKTSALCGGGGDLPALIGVRTTNDIYSFWFGPRGGFDILSCDVSVAPNSPDVNVSGKHFYGGLV